MVINIENPTTKRQTLGQILVCALGCCCNRTDKGKPAVPVDWLKKEFKERRLLRHIQLTFAGCLGPCDLVNVVTIVTPQETIWLGGLTENWQFEELLNWAIKSAEVERLLPIPQSLEVYRFERWKEPVLVEDCECCETQSVAQTTIAQF
jgi:hypothetical protein